MGIRIDPHRRRPAAGDLVPVQAEDGAVLRRPWVCTQIHVACQVVVTRRLGQGIRRLVCGVAAVLLLHQLICPRHELAVHVLGVIADAPGVLPLVAAGAVRVVANQVQEDVVVIVEGQVIGAVIIGEEAYQRCRAVLDHSDGRRIGEAALLFRRDADAGAFIQLAVQRDGRSGRQIDVGAAARDRRGAAHGQRAVVIHTASAAVVGDEASVEVAHTGVIHAAALGGGAVVADGAAVHIECTVVVHSRAVGRAGGAPQPSVIQVERTAVVHGVDRSAAAGTIDIPLDRGALRQGEGHAAANGNGVIRGRIKSKLPDGLTIQAEHRAVRGTPCAGVTQRHIACQIVLARILGQGVGRGIAAGAVLAGRLVVRPRGIGHVAVLRMAAGRGATAADAVDMGIQADIVVAGLPDLGMAPVQHGGIIAGIAVLPPVVPGCAAVEKVCDLTAAELVLRLAAIAVVAVCAVVAIYDLAARLLIGDGARADDVAYRAVGLGLRYVAVEIAVGDGARVLIGDAACPAAVVHLDAAAAQFARVHIAGLDGAVVGIDQTAQAALGRYSASVPAVGDGAVVDARQGSAGIERIILALALRHGDIRQLRAGTDIAEQSLSPAIQPHADRVAVAVEGAGIRVIAGADGGPDLIHVRHILLQLRAGVCLTGVHRVPQPDELRRAGDLIGSLRRAAAAGLRADGVGQHRGLIGVRLSRQRQHRGSRRVVSGQVQPGRLLLRQGLLRLVVGVQLAGDLVRVGVRDVLRCR